MPKFTPGPWKVTYDAGFYVVFSESTGDVIAVMCGNYGEREGNAYMVAAAPDMYEALRLACDYLHNWLNDKRNPEYVRLTLQRTCELVRQALAKAGGKEKTGG